MLFALKKIVSRLFFPVPLTLILLAVAVFFAFRKKASVWVKAPLLAAFLLLFIGSYRGTANLLLRPLESMYPAVAANAVPQVDAVVVLGAGVSDIAVPDPLARLPQPAVARLAEAVRLTRLLPEVPFVCTGYAPDTTDGAGHAMRDAAIALGVPEARIQGTARARDTAEEAAALVPVLGKRPFLLVTSAVHMPRAMRLCRARGLQPVAAPADFQGEAYPFWSVDSVAWDVGSLHKTTSVVYEALGILWGACRGWFAPTPHA